MAKFEIQDDFSQIKRRDGTVDPRVLDRLHETADTDKDQLALHHTLGVSHNQASPGDHSHDGSNSRQLMAGVTITGSKGGNVALGNLIAALASAFGFTDSTT